MSPVNRRASLPIYFSRAALLLAGCGLLQDAEAPSGTPEVSLPAAGEETGQVDGEGGDAVDQAESGPSAGASTTIMRSDYNLTIPSVPQVEGVDDEVTLEISFVAVPTG